MRAAKRLTPGLAPALVAPAVVVLALLASAAPGQAAGDPEARPVAGGPGDTLLVRADSASGSNTTPKSTTTAMILSAILPGAGQFYNESYWKVPIFLGLGTYFAYEFFYALNKYNEYSNLYDLSVEGPSGGNERFRSLRDFYRQERDRFGWYFLILYIANLVDAYVDATLSDFTIHETLSLRVTPVVPGPAGPAVGVGLRLRF